jgi:acetolactate synthase-1/2/3 large subunit
MTPAQSMDELEAMAGAARREAARVRGDVLSGPQSDAFFKACAAALRASPPGKAAMLLGGAALLTDGNAIHVAGAIAAATGAALLCENGFARVDRGAGIPAMTRIPYFPREAAKAMGQYTTLLLVDARLPVPMFGYAAGPREVVSLPDDAVWDIDAADTGAALRKLAACLGIPGDKLAPPPAPLQSSWPAVRERPELRNREAALTPSLLCAVVAALQPAHAIIVDEALTTGTDYWAFSADAPPFSHLTLTGGAIGQGPPAAVGAAVACPTRQVINLQADGSGLYSVQALWTQARERLNVVTVVCANSKYNILKIEVALQRCGASGQVARSLTDLGNPRMDWVALAHGFGVAHAVRVATVGALVDEFTAALRRTGPTVIEATLP